MSGPRFSPEEKRGIVLTLLAGRAGMAGLCREHQVSSAAVYGWRDRFLEGGLRALQGEGPSRREADLERENARLKAMVGGSWPWPTTP